MTSAIPGFVKDGVVVPRQPLPEGAEVEIHLRGSSESARDVLAERFRQLAGRWRLETAHLSNMAKRALHPAYQEIVGMGAPAIPLILAEMKRQPGQWFWALHAITGADPVAETQRGNLAAMTAAWLEWGRQNGYQE